MRRKLHNASKHRRRPTREIEGPRLAEVCGGVDLGIAVTVGSLALDIVQMQHNEVLIQLSSTDPEEMP